MDISNDHSGEHVNLKADLTLRELADTAGLPIGVAVNVDRLSKDAEYGNVIAKHFNMCVAENQFKPAAIWKGEDKYDFVLADYLASFARQHGMLLRGHTLLWHESVPAWLRDGGYSSESVASMLREYIHCVVGRYRGQMVQWDVVNEAISDEPGNHLRDTFWLKMLGPNYLHKVFEWAHEADPEVSLYYNDYEAEAGPKSDAVYNLVSELLRSGVPIHGVGMQCHFENGWRLNQETVDNVSRIEALGLQWQATETDVRMWLDGQPATTEQLANQALAYGDLTNLCLSHPGCAGLLFWGVSDAHSWIPGFRKGWGAPLPLDEAYRPKPAYSAVSQSLLSRVIAA